jgi:hypothetical protein
MSPLMGYRGAPSCVLCVSPLMSCRGATSWVLWVSPLMGFMGVPSHGLLGGPCPPVVQNDDFLKGAMKGKQPKRAPAHQSGKLMIS